MPASKLTLASEVKYLKGVGPARAELLASRGIQTVEDLLYYTPFRYEDRTRISRVLDLLPGQTATVLSKVLTCGLTKTRGGMYIYDLAAVDASDLAGGGPPAAQGSETGAAFLDGGPSAGDPARQGPSHANSGPRSEFALSARGGVGRSRHSKGMIRCKWFNAVYLEKGKVFRPGQTVFFYGKVDRDPYGTGNFQIIQPQFEIVQESEPVRAKNKLMDRASALGQTHFPDEDERLEDLCRFRTPAQVRLIFEEFFNVGAGLALKRRKARSVEGVQFGATENVRQAIKKI